MTEKYQLGIFLAHPRIFFIRRNPDLRFLVVMLSIGMVCHLASTDKRFDNGTHPNEKEVFIQIFVFSKVGAKASQACPSAPCAIDNWLIVVFLRLILLIKQPK